MKVIHCLNHYLPHHIAGTEVYTHSLILSLQKEEVESVVIIPNYNKDLTEEYYYEGIKVILYAEPSVVDRALIMGKTAPAGLFYFKEVIERENPDLVQFHELAGSNGITLQHVALVKELKFYVLFTFHLAKYTCMTNSLMKRDIELCDGKISIKECTKCSLESRGLSSKASDILFKSSAFLKYLNFNTTTWNSKIGTALGFTTVVEEFEKSFKLLINLADQIVVLTKWYEQILIKNGVPADKIKYIRQGLTYNGDLKRPLTKKTERPLKIIFIGRISHFKGVHILIDAVKYLDQKSIEVDIYGQESEVEYSRSCKKASAANGNIRWKGRLERNIIETTSKYDILCLPSTFSEMSPLVIQEAFAAGVPVIASNVYGNAEQISHDENGWLFKFKDSSDLKNILERLIANPKLIDNAKQKLPAPPGFGYIAKEYKTIYIKAAEGLYA